MDTRNAAPTPPDAFVPTADPLEETLRAALAPRFVVLRLIGTGGMARVYLARESALKRLVAVKVLAPHIASSVQARERFEREAQAVASLSHPNIVPIFGVGELPDGTPYFVMQYVNGRSLASRIDEQGAVNVQESRRIIGEVAAALAAAHEQGVIHRDIKAANILQEDASGRVLVSDFGIAAVAPRDEPALAKLTSTGVMLGTPMYMSPEQLLQEPVSEKTDVYALGLLAHELVAGSGPFVGSTPGEIIAAHLRDTPKRLAERRPGVDPELDEVVAKCLEKDAARRPTAAEIAKRFVAGSGTLLEWPPPGLDDVLGALSGATRYLWIGSLAVAAGIMPALILGVRSRTGNSTTIPLLLALLALAGMVALSMGLRLLARIGAATVRAVRAGYGWVTALEVLSDRRGDTSSLIAGTREYATLTPESRSDLRRRRVAAAVAQAAGGLFVVPLMVVAVRLGSTGTAGIEMLWVMLGICAATSLEGVALELREHRLFAKQREARDRAAPGVDLGALAAPWNSDFETARATQPLGRGSTKRPALGRIAAWSAVVVAAGAMLVVVPLLVFQSVLPIFWGVTLPKFNNTTAKIQIASVTRPFVLPRDSSISALDAGRAYVSIVPLGDSSDLPMLPVVRAAGTTFDSTLAPDLFPTARPDYYKGLPSSSLIVKAARNGFTPREMAWLSDIAHRPFWSAFHRVAVAPKVDYVGARFVLPFPASTTMEQFPVPRGSSWKVLAYADVARGAYYLARGQRDSAEMVFREVVSFGFNLVDQSNTLLEELYGVVIVGIGRGALIDYYAAVGDPRGRVLAARQDSVVAAFDRRDSNLVAELFSPTEFQDALATRQALIRIAADRSAPRGIRMEMLSLLGAAPCTNLREMIYGPDDDVVAAYTNAKKTWARFASDTAQLEVFGRIVRDRDPGRRLTVRLMSGAARLAGSALANPRVGDCADVYLSIFHR